MIPIRTFSALLTAISAFSVVGLGCDSSGSGSSSSSRSPNTDARRAALGGDLPPPGAKATFYKFGAADSKIGFTAAKVTQKHEGSFKSFEGAIGLVNNDPHMSAVQVAIDLDSVSIEPAKLATHLKSADFFDVAKFPKATFSSTAIRPGSEPSTFNVTGKLDLHGVSKPLTFPAVIRLTPEGVDANGEIKLNRKDYGIVYPGMANDLISDDVTIELKIHAERAKQEPSPEGVPPPNAPRAD
jgi:polyisoprenoid-binding protein YceI